MKVTPFLILLLFCSFHIFAQSAHPLKLVVNYENPTSKINDGSAVVTPIEGQGPFLFKWDKQSISLNSEKASELTEGVEYKVIVTDNNGVTDTAIVFIDATSLSEKINSLFVPFVDGLSIVIMSDIFAGLKLYDPTIHDDQGNIIYHPNGDPQQMKIPLVVVWLVLGALFFTIRMKLINIRGFIHAIQLVRGRYDDPANSGEVSHFQALTTALSGTVGLGNIAGVAIAISIGGPGATFWMIIAGLLGMSSKFVECTLGVKYRVIDDKGEVSGGPMYYLSRALKDRGLGGLGKVMAFIFAVLVVGASFGGGNMFQANQAFNQFTVLFPAFSSYGPIFGFVLAIVVGVVIIGGIKGIARVTDKIVPFMAVMYVIAALVIIFMNIGETGHAFSLIIDGAFYPSAIKGGIIGVLILGFQRAAFSNEAGVGSASIAHSAAKTKHPVSEGIVSLLEPFIDTVVICTMTALVLIFTGFYKNPDGMEGAQLTSAAFEQQISWFPWVLGLAIILFAFSTMISWSYYGLKGFTYLFGNRKKYTKYIYFVIFLGFIVVGSSSQLGAVVDFSDMMILAMAFPNIMGLVILSPEVARDLKEYFQKIKSGEIKRYK